MSQTPTPYILLKKRAVSDWISCRSITSNLQQLYLQKYGAQQVKTLFSDEGMDLYQSYQLLQSIVEAKPQYIVWIDHHPHPYQLIKALYDYYIEGKFQGELPTLVFHIFGDFSLQTPQWSETQDYLKCFKAKFYVASHAQKGFFDQFVHSEDVSTVLPFPSAAEYFYFSPEEREQFRSDFSLSSQDIALLYSGRLSRQKNIIEVIEHFKAAKEFLPQGTKLFIAGEFDDIDVPFIGIPGILGSFQRLWLKSMGQSIDDSIVFLGNLSVDDLRTAYNGCDLFCSMSTHNDEDFGMAPAEAALTGLPLLLSRWGGYQSFKTYLPESCTLVEVDLVHRRIIPRSLDLQKKLLVTTSMLVLNNERRQNQALKAQASLSLEGIQKLFPSPNDELARSEFQGFNSVFEEFAKAFQRKPEAPFRDKKGKYNKFYHEVYRPYFDYEANS